MARYSLVALGGTFDHLHKGHEALLLTAFEIGDTVIVGITSDEFVKRSDKQFKDKIQPFNQRQGQVKAFLIVKGLFSRARLVTLEDPLGPIAYNPEIKAVVVTEGTEGHAAEANRLRKCNSLPLLAIHKVPYTMAEDRRPISSARIRNKEVDAKGNLVSSCR